MWGEIPTSRVPLSLFIQHTQHNANKRSRWATDRFRRRPDAISDSESNNDLEATHWQEQRKLVVQAGSAHDTVQNFVVECSI
jgi:hypothetical protein